MKNFTVLIVLALFIVWIISTMLMSNLHDFLFDEKTGFKNRKSVSKTLRLMIYIILVPVYLFSTIIFFAMCFISITAFIFLVTQLITSIFPKLLPFMFLIF